MKNIVDNLSDLSASLQNRARPKRHKKMETISSVFRHSFRRQSITSPNTDIAATATSTIDTNNNSPIIIRKKSCTCCGICGKRLLKLAKYVEAYASSFLLAKMNVSYFCF